MKNVFDRLYETGIVPVAVLEDVKDAVPLGNALLEGGLRVIEVTFRTEHAAQAIRILRDNCPLLTVGAGTVLTSEQADRAVDAGADFVVTPGYDEELVRYCLDRKIPVCPGTMTPGEMMSALRAGLTHVKFFPAAQLGGIKTIEAIGAALSSLQFMPTGGITAASAPDYLKSKKVFCCGGSWMVGKDIIRAGDFAMISKLAREAADIVKEART